MPAPKPPSLIVRDETKKKKGQRAGAEEALTPTTQISKTAPAVLKDHAHAQATWRRLLGLYLEVKGTIVTSFDADLLVKYCLAEEELGELYSVRQQVKKLWDRHVKVLDKFDGDIESKDLKWYYNALAQANALLGKYKDFDARLDGKRKMIVTMAQSLYLTPRSRAGVAPPEKPNEEPDSPMEKALK